MVRRINGGAAQAPKVDGPAPKTEAKPDPIADADQFAAPGPSAYAKPAQASLPAGRGVSKSAKGALAVGLAGSFRFGAVVPLEKIRDLDLPTGFLSAASGVVHVGDHLIIAADDDNHLGVFPATGDGPGTRLRVLEGELPEEHAAKKAAKPDFEAITFLDPKSSGTEDGAVIAFGSGSTDQRERAVLLSVAADGRPSDDVTVIDLGPLYSALRKQFTELNIEGATITGDSLRLLQRGNGADGVNATIDLDAKLATDAIARGRPLRGSMITDVTPLEIGAVGDVPLTFTDASALPDGRVVFTAAAEDTPNPYDDGEIVGSAVGIIGVDGQVERVHAFDQIVKIEGVHATLNDDGAIDMLLVTDNDDPSRAGELFSARLPAS